MALLYLENIVKTYTKGNQLIKALGGISLSIEEAEFLCIVGPSGSGKSTLLNIIGCLDSPTDGSITYAGKSLHSLTEKELSLYRRDNISFIFQSFNLIPVLTVIENVELPLVIENKQNKIDIRNRALAIVEQVGLHSLSNRYPRELSGGQEQRVAIARALVKNPLIVLADEPTANLDSENAEDIISVMETMNKKFRTTFIFSTHDPRVEHHAHRKIVLKDGAIFSDERIVPCS